jgi:hypothetical protein
MDAGTRQREQATSDKSTGQQAQTVLPQEADNLRFSEHPHQAPASVNENPGTHGAAAEPYQRALLLWLQWNDAYQRLAEVMFQAGADQQAIQASLDVCDRMRQDAARLSRELLGLPRP